MYISKSYLPYVYSIYLLFLLALSLQNTSTVPTCPEFRVCIYLLFLFPLSLQYISTVPTCPEFTEYIYCCYCPIMLQYILSAVPTCHISLQYRVVVLTCPPITFNEAVLLNIFQLTWKPFHGRLWLYHHLRRRQTEDSVCDNILGEWPFCGAYNKIHTTVSPSNSEIWTPNVIIIIKMFQSLEEDNYHCLQIHFMFFCVQNWLKFDEDMMSLCINMCHDNIIVTLCSTMGNYIQSCTFSCRKMK